MKLNIDFSKMHVKVNELSLICPECKVILKQKDLIASHDPSTDNVRVLLEFICPKCEKEKSIFWIGKILI